MDERIKKLLGEDKMPFSDEIKDILGRPCFTLGSLARLLIEQGAYEGRRKAEDEQAVALHFMLRMYLNYGENWVKEANEVIAILKEKPNA